MQYLKSLAADLVQLLFPKLCNACGKTLVKTEHMLCLTCLYDLPYTDFHSVNDNQAARQFWGRIPCIYVVAMLYFKKGTRVQQILHNLKYRSKPELGVLLGKMLGQNMQKGMPTQIDFIIPVPLHWKKEKIRGYNQSFCIAEGLGTQLNLRVLSGVLLKGKATSSQTKKGRFSRYENLKSAFRIKDEALINDKHILLVDDVITSGATLEACATVLIAAGIKSISIAAVAYTI